MRVLRLLPLFVALALPSLAGAGRKQLQLDIVDDALAYADADRDKAARLLEDAIVNEPSLTPDQLDLLRVHAGEQRRLMGETGAAVDWFRQVKAKKGAAVDAATLGMALVNAIGGVDADLRATLRGVSDKTVLPTMNADRYLILATEAAQQNDAPAVKEYSKKALVWSRSDDEVQARVRAHLEAMAKQGDEPKLPEPVRSPLERAELAYADGREDDARRLAEQVLAVKADGDDALAARYLVRRLDGGVAVQPKKIGVLLPLSGKYESAAKQIRQALELGYGGAGRQLVYVDQGETTESAVAALEQLVFEHGVVAVVGPLRTEGTDEVARAANAMRIPLLGLSQAVDAELDRPWVVQAMVTPEDQSVALVAYAMEQRGMKKFAIFAPDNNYGRIAAKEFREEVEKRGGNITVEGFYDPEATDVIPFAKTLGRKDYAARRAELTELRKQTEERGGDPTKVVLPPIVDFDAMFVPDSASRLPIACAGLAYEEFPIGEFKPTKDSKTVPLLGLSGWNNDTLVTRGGPYVRGGLFTDVYHGSNEGAAAFEERYRAEVGRAPSALEAITYDVGKLLGAAARTEATTPAELRDALLAARIEGAITGTDGFDPATRAARHQIRILTVTADQIRPAPQP